eukprot:1345992-Amorphochlora_amoeboformis.AAC.1
MSATLCKTRSVTPEDEGVKGKEWGKGREESRIELGPCWLAFGFEKSSPGRGGRLARRLWAYAVDFLS